MAWNKTKTGKVLKKKRMTDLVNVDKKGKSEIDPCRPPIHINH